MGSEITRMRVTRSLMMVLAVALLAAGCAAQPVAYVQMAPTTPNSLDTMAYGAPAVAAPAAPVSYGRGLLYPQQQAYTAAYPQQAYATAYPRPQAYSGYPQQAPSSGLYNSVGGNAGYQASYGLAGQPAYTLDAGDRLRVVVFGQDGLTNAYVVGASGYIAMPLIGQVMARGLTTDELSSRIADKLKDGYIREPHVAVEIEAYRPFFILGEVTQPGQYPYVANMTAETAVAIAGGFTPRASRSSVILTRTVNGQQVRMSVPVTYTLRPGDTVSVQERWF
jgi:polysaccharide biosynthesis/export protein